MKELGGHYLHPISFRVPWISGHVYHSISREFCWSIPTCPGKCLNWSSPGLSVCSSFGHAQLGVLSVCTAQISSVYLGCNLFFVPLVRSFYLEGPNSVSLCSSIHFVILCLPGGSQLVYAHYCTKSFCVCLDWPKVWICVLYYCFHLGYAII